MRAEQRGGEHERVADVVAVADVGEVEAAQTAEALFEGHEVGDGLAGMLEIAEGVDDGHAGVLRHFGDGVVRVGAQDDDLDTSARRCGRCRRGIRARRGATGSGRRRARAAEGVHGGLKGEPRAQRGLLEEHDHLLRVEGPAIGRGVGLDVVGELEDAGQLRGGEVGDGAEVAAGEGDVGGGLGPGDSSSCTAAGLVANFLSSGDWGSGGVRQLFGQDFVESGDGLVDVLCSRRCRAAGSAERFRWCD